MGGPEQGCARVRRVPGKASLRFEPGARPFAFTATPLTLKARMNGTLLVVDDEQANLDSLDRIFEREGLKVLRASSGQQAVEILRSSAVDVV
jgi:PleD family two-component response regulator